MQTLSAYKQEQYVFNKIPVIFKDAFLSNINFDLVKEKLIKLIPEEFVEGIDAIYVGYFDFLTKRDLTALYNDNVIYVNSVQRSNESLILSIIHEVAHHVEGEFGYGIYVDRTLILEFVKKRIWLYNFLLNGGHNDIPFTVEDFMSVEYDKKIEDYLFGQVDYDFLLVGTASVFLTPYSAVSLSEYFAVGFEYYFGIKNEAQNIKNVCPNLHEALEKLCDLQQDGA